MSQSRSPSIGPISRTGPIGLIDTTIVVALVCFVFPVSCLRTAAGAEGWHEERGVRWAPLASRGPGKTGFTRLAGGITGIAFTNTLDEWSGAANRVLYNGAGVAAGDIDGDGLPDLFFCNLSGTNAVYRNLGNLRFQEITADAGLGSVLPQTRGATFADINGDGSLDLLVSVNGRGVVCFQNNGHGKFVDVTAAAGTASRFGSTSLALADVDGNGSLDLYVANYRTDDIRDRGRVNLTMINGRPILRGGETNRFVLIDGRLEECGQPDQLYLNDGTGRFRPVDWTGGTFLDESGKALAEVPLDWGLSATFRDVNGDGAPDLYVFNDYWTPDRFWINDGHGQFRALDRLAWRKMPASSMGGDFADIDRDGDLDFFAVDMLSRSPSMRKRQSLAQVPRATSVGVIDEPLQVLRNTLLLNRGDLTFAEIAYAADLPATDWSWSPLFVDVDLDGFDDLLIGAGHFRDVQDYDAEGQIQARQRSWNGYPTDAARQQAFTRELMEHYRLYPLLPMPIGGFRNRGDCRFEEVTETWGLNEPGIHQGMALADLDQDGDLDLAVNTLNSTAVIYRNEGSGGRVVVRLKGLPPNTRGVGATVTLVGGAVPRQSSEVVCGGRYQSSSDTELVFATGRAAAGMSLEVRWRTGSWSVVKDVGSERVYEVEERAAGARDPSSPAQANPLFEDVSERLGHRHHEVDFDDYARQPLLPFKLSQLGPGIAWADLDADGHDDLAIGSGRGGRVAVFRGDGKGAFQPAASPSTPVPDDTAGMVVGVDAAGSPQLWVALTGYESRVDAGIIAVPIAKDVPTTGVPIVPGMTNAGALAITDLKGDGRLVLFVAGGVLPGQYPLGTPSRLYRFDGRQWNADPRNVSQLASLGIVNGAVWSDLNGDGVSELVLACEWGPIRVFRDRGGLLVEVTSDLGLGEHTGWWRGVTTGDFDGDGRLDIVASNWGSNSPYRATPERPLVMAYGQLAQPGVTEVIETEYVSGALAPRRRFQALATSMPFLLERFATHKAYSEANLVDVLGDRAVLSRRVSVNTLASMAFLNRGDHFVPVDLPREAQYAPAFAVNVADLDGDGNEDVFLGQNDFDLQPEVGRIDAGLGLWLRGDGKGQFRAESPSISGIRVHGEQRGAALADFDEDGRVDLAVTQNGATTRLLHNRGAKPGLRVRLSGSNGNPAGLGAAVWLEFDGRAGPVREVHGGSGYWSQDSSTLVLATPAKPSAVRVRWPGGRVSVQAIPENAREIVVSAAGP